MTRESVLAAFSNLNREAGSAPHKPLLALYAVSQWLHSGKAVFRFVELEEPVTDLIRTFGGAGSSTARDPFWFLRSDGIWMVESAAGAWAGSDRPTLEELHSRDARGRFTPEVLADLEASPGLAVELIGRLLGTYFDSADHRTLLGRLGL